MTTQMIIRAWVTESDLGVVQIYCRWMGRCKTDWIFFPSLLCLSRKQAKDANLNMKNNQQMTKEPFHLLDKKCGALNEVYPLISEVFILSDFLLKLV